MKTYAYDNEHGFEIDNIYVGVGTVARILKSIDGVSEIKQRKPFSKWEYIHVWFQYLGHEYIVFEPFGDSSRYWIGSKNHEKQFDFSAIEIAFRQYQPPLLVKILGDLATLNFKSIFTRS